MTTKTTKTTKILESLTHKQDAVCDKVAKEYIDDVTRSIAPKMAVIKKWLKIVYKLYDLEVPSRIEIVASPYAALDLMSELTSMKQDYLDANGISNSGWVAFYDVFHRIGVIDDDEAAEILALREFMRCAWDTVLLDECAIVVRRPVLIRLDDQGNLHSGAGPVIEWADGKVDYAWHGLWVPEKYVLDPRSHTKKEFLAITNTELRRALSELAGWQWVMDLLGTKTVDTWKDPKTGLNYRLLELSEGGKLLVKQSPPLLDKSQPEYIEPVHEDLKTAQAARKWQATDWSPQQCESDPHLEYNVEA